MISDIDYKYFQPVKDGEMPEELFSFQAFRSEQECKDWLWQHDYDADEWDICEFNNDEIEGVTLIDEYGDQYPNIEDLDDNELFDLILGEVSVEVGSLKEKKPEETQQEYEDRLYSTAHDAVMQAIEAVETKNEYNFAQFGGSPDTEWYDSVRERLIASVLKQLVF